MFKSPGSLLILCLQLRQQILKVRSGPNRLEVGAFPDLGGILEALINGLSQGSAKLRLGVEFGGKLLLDGHGLTVDFQRLSRIKPTR